MRYFEIVKPSTKQKLSDKDQREPSAGNPRIARMKSAGNRQTGTSTLLEPQDLISRHVVGS
jgi:hypothetical protein